MNTTTTRKTSKSDIILLSKKGMKELRREITQLEHDLSAIRRSLRESDKTSGHDDRFERNEKLLQLESIEFELFEKQNILSKARLIPSKRDRVRVAVGSVVDMIDQHGRMFSYTLVESIEANPSDGRISTASPLGSTLVGKTVKDVIEWGSGPKHTTYRLINIS